MSLVRRVLARAMKRGLVMPPRQLVSFVGKLEKEIAHEANHLKAAVEELFNTDERLGTVSRRELFGAMKVPFSGLNWATLYRPIQDMEFGFSLFHQEAQKAQSQNFRVQDRIADLVLRHLRAAVDSSSPLIDALGKTAPERVQHALEEHDWQWNEKYEEGVNPAIVEAVSKVHSQLDALVHRLTEALARVEAFSTGDVKPDKVETLYHASVRARQIHAEGFKAEVPKDQIGLGGSQTGAGGHTGISFTYDLKAALDIARSFKESAMIATGELKASDILDWGAHDIDLDKFSMWLKIKLGDSYDKPKVEHDGNRWVVKKLDRDGKTEEVSIDEALSRPIDVFNVYDAFLFSHPTRMNPVHMNRARLLEYLKDADPKDIGVVAADVDMTHPGVMSAPGEREFRVPPVAVVKVTKFFS